MLAVIYNDRVGGSRQVLLVYAHYVGSGNFPLRNVDCYVSRRCDTLVVHGLSVYVMRGYTFNIVA